MTRPATLVLAAEAATTGAWLGATQVALGFALMAEAGSSVTLFLFFVGVWLLGGALGATLAARRVLLALLGAAVLVTTGARWALAAWPMSAPATVGGLGAGLVAGAYAGAYLRHRAAAWDHVRRLLLHENNGFLVGFVTASAALFCSTSALEVALGLLAAALVATHVLLATVRAAGQPVQPIGVRISPRAR